MTVQYVTSGGWGTGTGAPLAAATIDGNFWSLQTQVNSLLASVSTAVSIASVTQPAPGQILVNLTNSTSQGPFNLPVATWNSRGTWAPSTAYAVNDTFQINGAVYVVLVSHTSATTFSAGANDGAGHNYYGLLFNFPSDVLPAGGATGQLLAKNTGADFDVVWTAPHYLTSGGIAGQALVKNSSTNYDCSWTTLPNGIPSAGAAGQFLAYGGSAGTAAWATTLALANGGIGVDGSSQTQNKVFASPNASTGAAAFRALVGADLPALVSAALSASTGTVSFDPAAADIATVTPTGDMTVNASATSAKRVSFRITVGGATSYNITFGTNFTTNGALATGTTSGKVWTIDFVGDSTGFYEVGRVGAM